MVTISKSFPPLQIEQLEAFEKKLGIELPNSYKEFLLTYNGGIPKPNVFLILGEGDGTGGSVVHWFFGIPEDDIDINSLFYYIDEIGNEIGDRVPEEFLPIARDLGGNLICLCIKGENKGKIYFWDHELEADYDELPTYDNLYFVANSFEEFLNSMVETV